MKNIKTPSIVEFISLLLFIDCYQFCVKETNNNLYKGTAIRVKK